MVINIKHFIITIIAIFLSLGIGIFIGIIIDSQQLFIEQQNAIVAQIEEEFDGFKQKNYELTSELEEYRKNSESKDKFLEIVYQRLVEENNVDLNVMVINMLTEGDYLDLKDLFNTSGIRKTIEVKVPRKDEACIKEIIKNLNYKIEINDNHKDEIQKISSEKIYSRLIANNYSLLPFYLKNIDYLDYQGNIYSKIDFVIIIDDGFNINNKTYKALRKEFVNLISNSSIPLMAIEKSDIDTSSIHLYKDLEIPTVDNVDTQLGKIAMLMILNGKKGHFGEKITADSLIPEDILNFNTD